MNGRRRSHSALIFPRRLLRFGRALRCVAWRSLGDVVRAFEDFDRRPAGRTEIWLRGLAKPVQLRNGTSDFAVFTQVFLMRQYALPIVPDAEFIVDVGANIGMASLYFLWRNPRARVVAIEPDSENHAIARENLEIFSDRCQVIHGAIWSERRVLSLSRGTYRDGRHWASQTVVEPTATSEEVQALTIGEIAADAGFERIDLLKIDIEGAELPVFRDGDVDFLAKTRCCAVECHGEEAAQAYRAAAERYGFVLRRARELTVAERPAEQSL